MDLKVYIYIYIYFFIIFFASPIYFRGTFFCEGLNLFIYLFFFGGGEGGLNFILRGLGPKFFFLFCDPRCWMWEGVQKEKKRKKIVGWGLIFFFFF